MAQYDPWNNERFGYPRKDAPAFQREWKPLSSSGVLLATIGTGEQTIVKDPSSVGVSGTIYLWGLSFVAGTDVAQAVTVKDVNDKEIITAVCSQNGPYFLQLSTPIQITVNSGLKVKGLSSTTNSYITPFYTTTLLKYE
jgi:hypothetical protein